MLTSCWRTGSCPRRRGGPAPAPSCPRSPHCPPAPPRGTPPPDHRHSFNYINGYNCQSHLNKKLTQVLDLFHEKYNLLHPKDHQLLKGGFKSHLNKMTSMYFKKFKNVQLQICGKAFSHVITKLWEIQWCNKISS